MDNVDLFSGCVHPDILDIKEAMVGDSLRTAAFSKCLAYRYYLKILWGDEEEMVQFIGLNPSTATHLVNDPTVKRCINYAKRWGFGGMVMSNLFAYRATDPDDMKKASEPIGEVVQVGENHRDDTFTTRINLNDDCLMVTSLRCRETIACWGNHGGFMNRGIFVLWHIIPREVKLSHLKRTAYGHPSHPLYLKADLPRLPFRALSYDIEMDPF